MKPERIDPEFTDAVVTYSHVPARGRASRRDLARTGRREPALDAAEVPVIDPHVIDPHDEADLAFAVRPPDLRGEPSDEPVDFDPDERRSPVSRYVFAVAALAIVAGIGVLAASVGIATIAPSNAPVGADLSNAAPPPLIATADPRPEVTPSASVREIPLATDAATDTAPVAALPAPEAAPPPVPRARPEIETASFAPQAGVASKSTPAQPATVRPAPAPSVAVAPVAAEPQGTDGLILSIEETLAKVDSGPRGTMGPGAPPADLGTVPVLPPATGAPLYPPVGDGYGGDGPTYDVLPPSPVTGNGYPVDGYPAGPVPPEPVPYGYPAPVPYDAYPPRPMGYESEPEERPGIVRRAIARTTGAVVRVFTRDP